LVNSPAHVITCELIARHFPPINKRAMMSEHADGHVMTGSYRELRVWQQAMHLVLEIYRKRKGLTRKNAWKRWFDQRRTTKD